MGTTVPVLFSVFKELQSQSTLPQCDFVKLSELLHLEPGHTCPTLYMADTLYILPLTHVQVVYTI